MCLEVLIKNKPLKNIKFVQFILMYMKFEYTVIIPIYNEVNTIEKVLEKISTLDYKTKIIVVDDGSSDGSENLNLEDINENIKHYKSEKNFGKGNALRKGLTFISQGDDSIAIFFDADDEIPTNVIEQIIETYEKDVNINAIFGSRFLDFSLSKIIEMGFHRYIANRTLTAIINFRFKQNLTDMETAIKSFKIQNLNLNELKEDGFEIEPEVTKLLIRSNIDIMEIPIKYLPRSRAEGKKISFSDGFKTLKYLINDDNK